MPTKYRGVYIKDGYCWISVTLDGVRTRISTGLPDTPKNRKAAADIAAGMRVRAMTGQPLVKAAPGLFGPYARSWLSRQDHLQFATFESYRKILDALWLPALKGRDLAAIRPSDIASVLASHEWGSPKTRNNALSVVRRVFDAALADGLIPVDPSRQVRFSKTQAAAPDPLTLAEVDAVLAWMENRPVWRNYFELAFFTGLRTSELIALEWRDVDGSFLTIERAKVRRRTKQTKTATIRRVELNSRALAALGRQRGLSFDGPVFLDPATGRQINDDKPPRLVWTAALAALGLAHRDAYQTRHTYATLCLMAGANPAWISRQLGHANMGMLLRVYGKWIERGGSEIGKVESAIAVD